MQCLWSLLSHLCLQILALLVHSTVFGTEVHLSWEFYLKTLTWQYFNYIWVCSLVVVLANGKAWARQGLPTGIIFSLYVLNYLKYTWFKWHLFLKHWLVLNHCICFKFGELNYVYFLCYKLKFICAYTYGAVSGCICQVIVWGLSICFKVKYCNDVSRLYPW